MTSTEIETAVDALLVDAMVDYSATRSGTRTTDKWEHDLWHVSFYRRGVKKSCEFEFRTGTGHRSEKTGSARKPKAASVLYSLVRDASARNQSFPDWCADYGCDSDSIKALNIYNECCEAAVKLRQVFNPAEIAKIEELTQDY
jgi:hypothetical protein